ncbi:MAG: 50S ribosomal protein L25/general stress protein Ctc [Desulfovibrio sp.]|nr:50S ribosomal protein L25/general stress protein Ctc [Desulfovibrio sp.]
MSIDKTLNVEKREGRGKGPSGRLRAKDLIPGVYYAASGENIMVQAPALPLEKMYESVGHTTVFNLEIDDNGKKEVHPVLIWQIQRHPYKKKFTHIDFYGVDLDKEIKVEVPLEYVGSPKGVKMGGKMETYREWVRLLGKPLEMPQKVLVDVSDLNIGDTLHISDLKLPENVKPVHAQDYAVVSVVIPTEESEEEGAEGAAEAAS